MMANSFVMAIVIAVGKIAVSLISAYAVVFFRFPLRMFFFWMIFITLMLPVEVRIIPTLQGGLRPAPDQHLRRAHHSPDRVRHRDPALPPVLHDHPGTSWWRRPRSTGPGRCASSATSAAAVRTNIAALFVILFLYGWNQYLWPLLITTSSGMDTSVIGITKMIGTGDAQTDWNLIMSTAVLAMLPPVAVILLMQRWFVKGLVETEK